MTTLKRILIAATLLLSLVGGASQAFADTGTTTVTAGATVAPTGIYLTAGVSWE